MRRFDGSLASWMGCFEAAKRRAGGHLRRPVARRVDGGADEGLGDDGVSEQRHLVRVPVGDEQVRQGAGLVWVPREQLLVLGADLQRRDVVDEEHQRREQKRRRDEDGGVEEDGRLRDEERCAAKAKSCRISSVLQVASLLWPRRRLFAPRSKHCKIAGFTSTTSASPSTGAKTSRATHHKESWDSHCQAISPTPGRADQKTTAQMAELDAAVQARLKAVSYTHLTLPTKA